MTTKIYDMVRIMTLKQQKFSQSDPVLIRQFSKKLKSDPFLIRPKLALVLIQSYPVLIRAHLCRVVVRDEQTVKFFSPSPVLICKMFENHYSDPVLIRQCKIMYFYFAL